MEDYKKKLKLAEELYNKVRWMSSSEARETYLTLKKIFPELAESEDELTWLKGFVKEEIDNLSIDIRDSEDRVRFKNLQRSLSWLEKQGEHANFISKIQVGDKVTRNEAGVLVNLSQLNRVAKKDEKQGEQKHSDKVEPKFKVGDIVRHKNGDTVTITQINEKNHFYYYKTYDGAATVHSDFSFGEECDWELDTTLTERQGVQKSDELLSGEDYGIDGMYVAIDILQKTLGEVDGYQSDDGILEHKCAINAIKKLYEQNPAWSEEDEKMLKCIYDSLNTYERNAHPCLKSVVEDEITWLKSIKDRVQPEQEWSEEDELMIKDAIHWINEFQKSNRCKDENDMQNSVTCENWLKSLKGRVQPQQQEWSEEDEYQINIILHGLDLKRALYKKEGNQVEEERYKGQYDWLKALKDRVSQPHWKPSEEQMKALEKECFAHSNYQLCRLLEDLEKL